VTEPLATIEVNQDDERTVIGLVGEIDLSNASALGAEITGEVTGHTGVVVVDLTEVAYIDTQGVRLLLQLARQPGITLSVVAPPEGIAGQVLRIAGLNDHLQVRERLDP
jgi:anti-sigma B factor antagonist